MIIKIYPIKGRERLREEIAYMCDGEKTLNDSGHTMCPLSPEFVRCAAYSAANKCIKSNYISGYHCDPRLVEEDFVRNYCDVVLRCGARKWPDKEDIWAYVIVQSWPEDADISDEEVHRCGCELVEKICRHQALICSHVHPEIDDNLEVHGKCKHNHILVSAYVMQEYIDPKRLQKVKGNFWREEYQFLTTINDRIAIEHRMPIICNPDLGRTDSYYEAMMRQSGNSWKEEIRNDIKAARRKVSNWDAFVEQMQEYGYRVQDERYITPDGKHRQSSAALGQEYTREGLEEYWRERNFDRMLSGTKERKKEPSLKNLALQYGALTVDVPIGVPVWSDRETCPLSLAMADRDPKIVKTYFTPKGEYAIRDAGGRVVAEVSGAAIVDFYSSLPRIDHPDYIHTYTNGWYYDSKKGLLYTVNRRDDNGRKKSLLELILDLAIAVLKGENGEWDPHSIPPEKKSNPIYAPVEWKIQRAIDAIAIAREEGLESPGEVDDRLQAEVVECNNLAKEIRALQKRLAMIAANESKNQVEMKELEEKILALQKTLDENENRRKSLRFLQWQIELANNEQYLRGAAYRQRLTELQEENNGNAERKGGRKALYELLRR